MDPVSLIAAALAAGASAGLTEAATAAVGDAYTTLKGLVQRLFRGRPVAEAVLDEHAKDPDGPYRDTLKAELTRADAAANPEIVAAARAVLEAADPEGTKAGKYTIDARGAQVGSIGDHTTVTANFGAPPQPRP